MRKVEIYQRRNDRITLYTIEHGRVAGAYIRSSDDNLLADLKAALIGKPDNWEESIIMNPEVVKDLYMDEKHVGSLIAKTDGFKAEINIDLLNEKGKKYAGFA